MMSTTYPEYRTQATVSGGSGPRSGALPSGRSEAARERGFRMLLEAIVGRRGRARTATGRRHMPMGRPRVVALRAVR